MHIFLLSPKSLCILAVSSCLLPGGKRTFLNSSDLYNLFHRYMYSTENPGITSL